MKTKEIKEINKIYKENNLYNLCKDEDYIERDIPYLFNKIKPNSSLTEKEQQKSILINHSKKEYVRLSDCKEKEKNGWIINPLPLLTSLGNGGGGGDYSGKNMKLVGTWAFDEISVEFDEDELIKNGFKKINTDFEEGESDGNNFGNDELTTLKLKEWIRTKEVKKRLIIEAL